MVVINPVIMCLLSVVFVLALLTGST